MTKEEYQEKMEWLKQEFKSNQIKLMIAYVDSNNPYKLGDIVTDHIGSIIVEKISCDLSYDGHPCAVYTGIELKKDDTPNKRGNKRSVWQSNIIKP